MFEKLKRVHRFRQRLWIALPLCLVFVSWYFLLGNRSIRGYNLVLSKSQAESFQRKGKETLVKDFSLDLSVVLVQARSREEKKSLQSLGFNADQIVAAPLDQAGWTQLQNITQKFPGVELKIPSRYLLLPLDWKDETSHRSLDSLNYIIYQGSSGDPSMKSIQASLEAKFLHIIDLTHWPVGGEDVLLDWLKELNETCTLTPISSLSQLREIPDYEVLQLTLATLAALLLHPLFLFSPMILIAGKGAGWSASLYGSLMFLPVVILSLHDLNRPYSSRNSISALVTLLQWFLVGSFIVWTYRACFLLGEYQLGVVPFPLLWLAAGVFLGFGWLKKSEVKFLPFDFAASILCFTAYYGMVPLLSDSSTLYVFGEAVFHWPLALVLILMIVSHVLSTQMVSMSLSILFLCTLTQAVFFVQSPLLFSMKTLSLTFFLPLFLLLIFIIVIRFFACRDAVVHLGYFGYSNLGDDLLLLALKQRNEGSRYRHFYLMNPESKHNKKDEVGRNEAVEILNLLLHSTRFDLGPGGVLQDSSSSRSLLYYLGFCLLARVSGAKVRWVGQGFSPIKSVLSQRLVRLCSLFVEKVELRDEASIQNMNEIGVPNSKIEYCPDYAWDINLTGYQPVKPAPNKKMPKRKVSRVHVCLRSWESFDCVQFVKEFKSLGIPRAYFLFQPDARLESLIREEDSRAAIHVYSNSREIREFVKKYIDADAIISMRYHGILLALQSGKPTFSLSYAQKCSNIALEHDISRIELSSAMDSAEIAAVLRSWLV